VGFLQKLISKGPGGPASVAKTMLKAHNTIVAINPGASDREALKFAPEEIESIYRAPSNIKSFILYRDSDPVLWAGSESLGFAIRAHGSPYSDVVPATL